jgi:HAD superfamily hydrolase (TIGR01509 family)
MPRPSASERSLLALIFDCDGVLVDTERDGHRVAFNQAFDEQGLDANWSVERYGALLKTAGGKERMSRHFDEMGWPVGASDRTALIASLHRRKTEIFKRLIEAGALPLRPGVARLVDEAIAAGIRLAVCSTSNERAVETVVKVMLGPERARYISIFAGDIVAAKKPDPAIYSLAAASLRCEPYRCIVIEDSNNGLRAAKAAGMNCIVTISSYTADEDFRLADRVVPDLDAGVSLAECRAIVASRDAASSFDDNP